MKLSILTTNTIHHSYFVQEAQKSDLEVSVIIESQNSIKNSGLLSRSFETEKKIFELKRDDYESQRWFRGKKIGLNNFPNVYEVDEVNSIMAIEKLKEINPELILVFGTRLIKQEMISYFKNKIFNLHGGDPEKYRGLDSHYWSIYHKDFESLVTTLHRVTPILDNGEIVLQRKIKLWPNMKLYQFRASNTELCVELFFSMLNHYKINRSLVGRSQNTKGRYYSLMPESLKQDVEVKFENYINKIF